MRLFSYFRLSPGSIRRRVALTLSVWVVILMLFSGGLAYLEFARMEDDLVNAMLLSQAKQQYAMIPDIEQQYTSQSEQLESVLQTWWIPTKAPFTYPVYLEQFGAGLHEFYRNGVTWHVLRQLHPTGQLLLLYDASPHENRVHRFGLDMLLYGALIVLMVFIVAGLLAKQAVRPLLTLTQHLEKWAPGKASLQIDQKDEAGRLAQAFNRMQDQVDNLLGQQRGFAASLSHEIRTSLASIRSDAELLSLLISEPRGLKTRVLRILQQVDAVTLSLQAAEQIHSLRPSERELVSVVELLGRVWAGMATEAQRAGVLMQGMPQGQEQLMLDAHALFMILRILLRNVCVHAAPCHLYFFWQDGHILKVQDTGPGIEEDQLAYLFERGYSRGRQWGDPESWSAVEQGLGLALARHLALSQNWSLTVTSQTGGAHSGTCFTLDLLPV